MNQSQRQCTRDTWPRLQHTDMNHHWRRSDRRSVRWMREWWQWWQWWHSTMAIQPCYMVVSTLDWDRVKFTQLRACMWDPVVHVTSAIWPRICIHVSRTRRIGARLFSPRVTGRNCLQGRGVARNVPRCPECHLSLGTLVKTSFPRIPELIKFGRS